MSRYSVTVPACVVQQAFASVDVTLPLQDEDVCLFFGYDGPLAVYFLDVEDADEYHEFGYGGIFFVPGTRLSRGQMLDVLHVLVDQASSDKLAMFRDAIVMDSPVAEFDGEQISFTQLMRLIGADAAADLVRRSHRDLGWVVDRYDLHGRWDNQTRFLEWVAQGALSATAEASDGFKADKARKPWLGRPTYLVVLDSALKAGANINQAKNRAYAADTLRLPDRVLACTGTGFRVKLNGKGQEGVVPFEDARLAFPHLPAAAKARLKAVHGMVQ